MSGMSLGPFTGFFFLQVNDEPSCAPVQSVADVVGWLFCQADAHSSLLVAAATIVTAVIAGLAHSREKNRIDERTDAADARIAGLAFAVRRAMENSLDDSWRLDASPAERIDRAIQLHRGFIDNERRVERMLAEASRASPSVAEDAETAARLFWRASHGVGELASVELPTHDDVPPQDAEQDYRDAQETTEKCIEVLRRLDAPIRESEG